MNTSPLILIVLSLTLAPQRLAAQAWSTDFAHYFDSIRVGARVAIPAHVRSVAMANDVVDLVKPYLNDSVQSVRIKSRELLFAVASSSAAARSRIIEQLLDETQIADPVTTGVVLRMIRTFSRNDFTAQAKANVRRLVNAAGPYLADWIRVAAFLGLRDLVSHVRPYTQPGNRESLRWSALVSLARLEDESAAFEVVNRVKRLPVNDDLIYKIFPDLLFTRDRSAIDYVIEILHEDAEHCLSADVEHEVAIPCGYRIMEQLASVIDGLPVQLDEAGDIRTADYPNTLAMVRQWFLAHRDYGINKERY